MIQEKKSQAAMEFMVTYGWVILGVMIVIGALAYYGIFRIDRYINDECSFGTQLYCEDVELSNALTNTDFNIIFRNNFGQQIYLRDIHVYYESKFYSIENMNADYVNSGASNKQEISIRNLALPKNEKVRLKVVVIFSRTQTSPPHNITGTIVATVK